MKHRPGGLLNDDLGMDFVKFLIDMSLTISEFNDGDIYCVISYSELHNMHPAFLKAGLHWSGTIAWVKDQFVIGRSKYHRRYETIWYGWKTKSSYVGDRKQDDVWEIPRPKSSLEHPTMKPVELVNKAIMNSSKRGDIVLDLFGGGGSTIVAAEKSGRHARLMELDPKYVDVIIKRWEMLTGQKAKKI